MKLLEIFPPANTTEKFARYFIDLGESGRWSYFSIQALLFYFLLFFVIYSFSRVTVDDLPEKGKQFWRKIILNKFSFVIFLIAFILVSRVPLAVEGFLNPDEAQWIAMAKTLATDPRYWVSADGGTGGPIVPFMLLLMKIFGIPIDFGSLKIMTGVIMAVSISFLYMSFDRIFGPVLSRLVILPLAVAVSFMRDVDMLSYNSEHPVILLLCMAFFFLSGVYSSGPGRYNARLVSLGFILGAVPFAKLQGVPMAFFIGLFACFVVYQTLSIKCLLVLMVSALMPALMILLTVSLYGGLESFWMSYIKFNLFYASESTVSGFGQRMAMLFQIMDVPKELNFFIFYSFSVIIIGLFLILSLAKISRADFVKLLFSIILLCITIFCIVAPGRTLIIHYLLLLLIPLTLLVAVVVDCVCKSVAYYLRREQSFPSFFLNLQVAIIYIFVSGLYHFHLHFTFKPSFLERASARYDGYCPQGDAVAVLNRYFSSGSKMAIWGWATELWSGTNFLMGTRDGNTGFLIDENPLQVYYVKRFLRDLEDNKPELFVEAVAPNFFRYKDRVKQGFKNSPLIKEYIDEHYRWEAEVGGIQIYLRRDMNPVKEPWVIHSPKPLTATKEFHCSLEEIIRNGSFLQFRGWTVVGDNTTNQSVMLALINERDTFLVKSYQIANKSVVDFSPLNRNNLMCGYLGFIPEQEIPPGHYQVGIYVENKGETGFKLMNRMLTFDPLLPTQKSF